MAQKTINLGTVPGDKTGDPGRVAFGKANDNFTELYASVANLLAALAGKADAGHLHDMAAVTGLIAALQAKADLGHGHTIDAITGLAEALAGLVPRATLIDTSSTSGLDGGGEIGDGRALRIDWERLAQAAPLGLDDIVAIKQAAGHVQTTLRALADWLAIRIGPDIGGDVTLSAADFATYHGTVCEVTAPATVTLAADMPAGFAMTLRRKLAGGTVGIAAGTGASLHGATKIETDGGTARLWTKAAGEWRADVAGAAASVPSEPPPDPGGQTPSTAPQTWDGLYSVQQGFVQDFPDFRAWKLFRVTSTADTKTVDTTDPDEHTGTLRGALTSDQPYRIYLDPALGDAEIVLNTDINARPKKVVHGYMNAARLRLRGTGAIRYTGSYFGPDADLWFHCVNASGFTGNGVDVFTMSEGFNRVVYSWCTAEDGEDECWSHTRGGTYRQVAAADIDGALMTLQPFTASIDGVAIPKLPPWWTTGTKIKPGSASSLGGGLPSGLDKSQWYWLEVVDGPNGVVALHTSQADALAKNPATRVDVGTLASGKFNLGAPCDNRVLAINTRIGNTPGAAVVAAGGFGADGVYQYEDQQTGKFRGLAGLAGQISNEASQNWWLPAEIAEADGGFGITIKMTLVNCYLWGAIGRLLKVGGVQVDFVNCLWDRWQFPDRGNANGTALDLAGPGQTLIRGCVARPYRNGDRHHWSDYQVPQITVTERGNVLIRKTGSFAEQTQVCLRIESLGVANGDTVSFYQNATAKTQASIQNDTGGNDTRPLVFTPPYTIQPVAVATPEEIAARVAWFDTPGNVGAP